jgi:transcriptional regulator
MRIKEEFQIADFEQARAIVRAHPFGTVITTGQRVTRMPFLVDEDAGGLAVLGHVARADPAASELARPLLVVFSGPHGYISASWYGEDTIPTWNHVTLTLTGRPELFDDAMPLLRRTVDHFEAAVEDPWSLDRMGETAREMADEVIAFRLDADSWHAEAKLSQDKPVDERVRVLAGLERSGPYENSALAGAMRRHS